MGSNKARKPRWTKKQIQGFLDKYGGIKAASEAEDLPLSSLYDYVAKYDLSVKNHIRDKYEFQAALDYYGSWEEMGRRTGVPASTLKSQGRRLGVKSPRSGPGAPKRSKGESAMDKTHSLPLATEKTQIDEDRQKGTVEAEYVDIIPATSDPHEMPDDKTLLIRANRDTELWEVTNFGHTVWDAQKDGEVFKMRSLKVSYGRSAKGKLEQIFPSFRGAPLTISQPKRFKRNEDRKGQLVVIMSDFHAPFHDRALLSASRQALLETQPDKLIINGDIVDWPTLGGKPTKTQDCQATADECVQAAGDILVALKAAVPEDCGLVFIPGNHDGWLSRYLLQKADKAAAVRQHGGEENVYTLSHLLRLEEKGYEMIGTEDRWEQATYPLTDRLIVWHGDATRRGSGASAIANMTNAEYATITGHTHRQAVASLTIYNAYREHKILQGAECGAMLKMPDVPSDWPTYRAHNKLDWQPGWVSVWIEEDQHYLIETASWQNQVLMWQGKRYEPEPGWENDTTLG